MNCNEAQEMFGWVWDLPESHPERRRLEWHLRSCEDCSAGLEIWQQSLELISSMPEEIDAEQAEAVNRRVMDRIYAESPWLLEGDRTVSDRTFRKQLKLWASGFMVVFLISVCLFAFSGPLTGIKHTATNSNSGLFPTAVAGSESVSGEHGNYDLTQVSSGIVDPYVVGMTPVHPQYWMVLSMVAMGLALLTWRGLRRIKH